MDLQIAAKTALVTGASRGIGFAIAAALAAEGARLVINGRDEEALDAAAKKLRETGADVYPVVADVAQAKAVKALWEAACQAAGEPSIVVANAGGPPTGAAARLDDASWAKGYDLTLMSAVRLSRIALPSMRAAGWGRLLFVTSISVKQPIAGLALSNAFRAGLTGFARTLASEVAAEGVTVNAVAPGYTATEHLDELFADDFTRARLTSGIPMKRFAEPREIASVAAFLCSEQASYLTGQTLMVDGGTVGSLL